MAIKTDAGRGRGAGGSALAEINIIPLVDVVLVLLLIFMLTAPMMYRGIDVNLPKTSGKPTKSEERLVLTVTKDREFYLNERAVPPASLEAQVTEAVRGRQDKVLYLKADAGLAYGTVVETMDLVKRAGVEKLGMVTDPTRSR